MLHVLSHLSLPLEMLLHSLLHSGFLCIFSYLLVLGPGVISQYILGQIIPFHQQLFQKAHTD